MGRYEELTEKLAAKVASFSVGDWISFHLYDENDSGFEMFGTILSINGNHAIVAHDYGECRVWLPIAHNITKECYPDGETT